MAPDPPRVDCEYVRSVNSQFLMMVVNSDDSDGYDDIDYNNDIVSLGYTILTGENYIMNNVSTPIVSAFFYSI